MNTQVKEIFNRVKTSKKTVHIKLLGDSITHGVGGTGFQQNGAPITENFARNPFGYCWAKRFKEYMEAHYNCTVTNNACTGTTIEFVLSHFDELVDEKDDVVICTIGTNNRHRYFKDGPQPDPEVFKEAFYQNILKLQQRFKESNKDFILVANIPASEKNEQNGADFWRVLHMDDINALYTKAEQAVGFPFISMYRLFSEYCAANGIAVDTLLSDGLHPNDKGYDVMFSLLTEALDV